MGADECQISNSMFQIKSCVYVLRVALILESRLFPFDQILQHHKRNPIRYYIVHHHPLTHAWATVAFVMPSAESSRGVIQIDLLNPIHQLHIF